MGFIKAFSGALSGTLADQWKDYYIPRAGVPGTAALFQAVPQSQNNGRGENYKGNENIITNGSKIVVPEGTALITLQDGQITGLIAEPGGFEFRSDDPNSQSMFAGDGVFGQTLKSTWEKVKFGGQPGSQQLAFYVNLKEIPNNAFGTQSEIYWDDSFLATQAGAVTRGTYSLKIVDPLLFVKNFVPVKYLQPGAKDFDFADMDNEAATQLFNEVVGSLGAAFSNYVNDPNKENRISKIQSDQIGFAKSLSSVIEDAYQWKSNRGLEITSSTIISIEYDEQTKELLKATQQDDREARRIAKLGKVYGENMAGTMAAASGQAMQTAAGNENGAMMGFMGMNMAQQNGANLMGAVNNMQQQAQTQNVETNDSTTKLLEAKKLLDAGAITQEDYDKIKAQVLGL